MLFLNVTFYQFALINAQFFTYRTYWHGDSIRLIYKHNYWTQGGSLGDNDEWERYTNALIKTDMVICLPGWQKYRPVSNLRNVTLARRLSETQSTSRIITCVCGYEVPDNIDEESPSFSLSCLSDEEDLLFCGGSLQSDFRKKLIDRGRYTDKFQHFFDRENGGWATEISDDVATSIVQYFLTTIAQILLQEKHCYGGKIDGIYSFRTKESLRKFQMLKRLPADGKPNRETWELLKQ